MIIIGVLRNLADNHRKIPSSQPQAGNSMGSHRLQLLQFVDVVVEYPAGIAKDVLSAAEIIVMVLAPAFGQLDVHVGRAVIEIAQTDVKITLYQVDDTPVKRYTLPIDSFLETVDKARQRVMNTEGVDLKQWVLNELDKAYRENKL